MEITAREIWAVIHGMMLGAVFLLAYAGGLAELINLGSKWSTEAGIKSQVRRLITGTWVMAVVAWLTVITGTYIVYPWYRAKPPTGADLAAFPRSFLLSKPTTAGWHNFGMEWKEHIAWIAPMLATAAAFIVLYYREDLIKNQTARKIATGLLIAALVPGGAAERAGLQGPRIRKEQRRQGPFVYETTTIDRAAADMIVAVDGLEHLVGFLEHERLERVDRLFAIPGAAIGRPERRDDLEKTGERLGGAVGSRHLVILIKCPSRN